MSTYTKGIIDTYHKEIAAIDKHFDGPPNHGGHDIVRAAKQKLKSDVHYNCAARLANHLGAVISAKLQSQQLDKKQESDSSVPADMSKDEFEQRVYDYLKTHLSAGTMETNDKRRSIHIVIPAPVPGPKGDKGDRGRDGADGRPAY